MLKKENLKSYIDELIKEVEEELEEANVTGNVDGYQTPFAFSGKNSSEKRKKTATQLGYTLVDNDVENIDESVSEATASEIVKDLDKVRNDLIKKVDVLIAKKKKLYSNVDIESPMSADEKQLDKDIQSIFSQIQQIIQQKRKIKESVNEVSTSFVSGNSGRTITNLDDKKYQLTKDVKGAQIGNYTNVVLPNGSIIHNLPGGVFVSHPSLKDKFSGVKEIPKFGFRVTTHPNTIVAIEKSSKILESVNEDKKASILNIDFNITEKGNNIFFAFKDKKEGIIKVRKIGSNKIVNFIQDVLDKTYGKGSYFFKSGKNAEFIGGYEFARNPNNNIDKLKFESVNEGKSKRPVNRWLELKNDESMHANKKLAVGLKELKHQLSEVEKFFRWYNQIKTMNELSSDTFWKRTHGHIYKIKERLINIAKTIQEIEK
jgi:hypothetical protein